jgi:peptide/nickel transport system permease protein
MRTYLIKRFLMIIPTFIGITLITFFIIQLAPGSPVSLKLQGATGGVKSEALSREIIEETRALYGLDRPIHVQYLSWLRRVVTLDFGRSYKDHRLVLTKVIERLPISLQLSLISIFLSYLISVPLGVYSATHQFSPSDKIITVVLFILYSLPSFWVASLLIMLLGGGDFWDVFPIFGLSSEGAGAWPFWRWLWDRVMHLVLPVTCLTYGGLASLSRYGRVGMLEVVRQDYIRTARAKGLSERVVIYKHALRNSVIPIVTFLGLLLPAMLGGSVIIETIFSIPGMGKLGFEAVLSRDYPVIMGIATISSLLTLVGLLISDILYVVVDPRISFE